MILQVAPDFFTQFLRGLQTSNQLLNSFLQREHLQQQMKAAKEQEKQVNALIEVGIQELPQLQQQLGAEAPPEVATGVQQILGQAANAQQRFSPTALRQAGAAPQIAAGLEKGRAKLTEQQERQQQQREHLDTARIMGFAGKDATDYAALMSRAFPNEQARLDAIQQRFPDIGMTEMQRLQAENIRQGMAARAQEMEVRRYQLDELRRQAEDLQRIESIARTIGQDPRLFRREFQLDYQIADSMVKDRGIASAESVDDLYRAQDTWATSAAGALNVPRERVLATIRPLNEQYRAAALSMYQGGATPDELVAQLSANGTLSNQANARLTRRWYEAEGLPLTQEPDDESRQALIEYVTAGLNEEARVLREAYRMAYRQGAVDTNLFRGVATAEFPAVPAAEPTAEAEAAPTRPVAPRGRAVAEALRLLGQYVVPSTIPPRGGR